MYTLRNKADEYKTKIAYAVLGSYMVGVAEDITVLNKNINGADIIAYGENLCKLNLPEDKVFDPFKEIDFGYDSAPKRLGYLKNLISYGEEKINDIYLQISNSPVSEEKKFEILKRYSNETSSSLSYLAFKEGYVDEELKEDLRTLIKDGKEAFQKRMQEANDQKMTVETVDPNQPVEQPQEGQDQLNFDDNSFDMGMADDESVASSGDLGFDTSFDEAPDFNNAANEMGELSSGEENEESDAPKAESGSIKVKELFRLGHGESFVVEYLNNKARYSEDLKYLYKDKIISFDKMTMERMVNNLLDFEKSIFEHVTASESLDVVNSNKYKKGSKKLLQQFATILVVREKLRLVK